MAIVLWIKSWLSKIANGVFKFLVEFIRVWSAAHLKRISHFLSLHKYFFWIKGFFWSLEFIYLVIAKVSLDFKEVQIIPPCIHELIEQSVKVIIILEEKFDNVKGYIYIYVILLLLVSLVWVVFIESILLIGLVIHYAIIAVILLWN